MSICLSSYMSDFQIVIRVDSNSMDMRVNMGGAYIISIMVLGVVSFQGLIRIILMRKRIP